MSLTKGTKKFWLLNGIFVSSEKDCINIFAILSPLEVVTVLINLSEIYLYNSSIFTLGFLVTVSIVGFKYSANLSIDFLITFAISS